MSEDQSLYRDVVEQLIGYGAGTTGVPRETGGREMTLDNRQLWLRLFLPFAAGYFLSYLYRTANAVIGPVLATGSMLAGGLILLPLAILDPPTSMPTAGAIAVPVPHS